MKIDNPFSIELFETTSHLNLGSVPKIGGTIDGIFFKCFVDEYEQNL
jgi:hypothetical protein